MEHNIKINENYLEVMVDTKIFPVPCVIRTLNDFTDGCYIILTQNSPEKILVRFIPREKTDLEELGYQFNTKLIATFVENSQPTPPLTFDVLPSSRSPQPARKSPNKKTERPSGQRSFIVVTRKCVNDCLFCTEADRRHLPEPTMEELKKILAVDCRSFPSIVFSGGEPTLRKEIFELVEYAKDFGYHVKLFTNGRLFANPEIAEKMAKAGLDSVLVPVHGHNPAIHDKITQRPGSFEQTIAGMKNLASNNVEVQVKIIPNKVNYQHLAEWASFVASLPYHIVGMDMLVVSGNALKNKDIVSIKLSIMAPYIEKAIDILAAAGKELYVGSLPLCLVQPKYRSYIKNDRIKTEINVGTGQKKEAIITNPGEILMPVCQRCLIKDKCPGTWAAYFKAYGESELKPIVK